MVRLLLDTNVVLDWLVFADPALAVLRNGLGTPDARVEILTYPVALAELQRVLAYSRLQLSPPRQAQILSDYQRETCESNPGSTPLPPGFPVCRDPDDQHFIEAACRLRVDALVSRDRQVLKLRRRARRFELRIVDVAGLGQLLGEQDLFAVVE